MKKSTTIILLFFLSASMFGQFARKGKQGLPMVSKGEITGKISGTELTGLSGSNKTIVINNNTINITPTTIISGQFVNSRSKAKLNNTRVRVFYKVEDNEKVATKIVEEKFLVPGFRILKPIPSYIPPTVISGIGMGNLDDLGKITSWGYGIVAEARVYTNFRLFFDMTSYSYKQELAEKGSTHVHVILIMGRGLLSISL
jgi:hypothetical protein